MIQIHQIKLSLRQNLKSVSKFKMHHFKIINRLILKSNGLRSPLHVRLQARPLLDHPRHQEMASFHPHVKTTAPLL